jgi:hypothetical protein
MSTVFRDLKIWGNRILECRNPLLWASALNYDLQRIRLLELATKQPSNTTASYMREIEDDEELISQLRSRLAQWTYYRPRAIDFMMSGQSGSVFFNEVTLYAIVRACRPEIMIETGGTPGKSTAFILRAMARNKVGHLYTIDLPPTPVNETKLAQRGHYHEARPSGSSSNWIVPDSLRQRHTLLLGKSSEHLPSLLEKVGAVDIFLHDSDHSYKNMAWEFETAMPRIKPDGLLLSDDVLANTSFFDYCRKTRLQYVHVFNLGAARVR